MKNGKLYLVLCIIFSFAMLTVFGRAFVRQIAESVAGSENSQAQIPPGFAENADVEDMLTQITFTGASFAAIDGVTGKPIVSYHGSEQRRPASLTKMMTAIIAYENLPLEANLMEILDYIFRYCQK